MLPKNVSQYVSYPETDIVIHLVLQGNYIIAALLIVVFSP